MRLIVITITCSILVFLYFAESSILKQRTKRQVASSEKVFNCGQAILTILKNDLRSDNYKMSIKNFIKISEYSQIQNIDLLDVLKLFGNEGKKNKNSNKAFIKLANQLISESRVSIDEIKEIISFINKGSRHKVYLEGNTVVSETKKRLELSEFFFELSKKQPALSENNDLKKHFQSRLLKSSITQKEESEILLYLTFQIKKEKDIDLLFRYILFLRMIKPKKRYNYLTSINEIFTHDARETPLFKKFFHTVDKIEKYKGKQMKIVMSNHPSKKQRANALKKVSLFEDYYYGCRSLGRTDFKEEKNRSYRYMLTGTATITSTASYAYINYDKLEWNSEKSSLQNLQNNKRWFLDLFYNSTVAIALSYINGRWVFNNLHLSGGKKLLLSTAVVTTEDLLVSYLYKNIVERMEKQTTEKQTKALKELVYETQKQLQPNKEAVQLIDSKGYVQNLNSVSKERIDESKSIEELIENLVDKIENNDFPELDLNNFKIMTGDIATDRFLYHRLFDFYAIPRTLILSYYSYLLVCQSTTPLEGYLKAGTLFALERVLSDMLYYAGRREIINQ